MTKYLVGKDYPELCEKCRKAIDAEAYVLNAIRGESKPLPGDLKRTADAIGEARKICINEIEYLRDKNYPEHLVENRLKTILNESKKLSKEVSLNRTLKTIPEIVHWIEDEID